MHPFVILGDPVRRRILELLAEGELSAGELGAVVQREFNISQPGVSQHLRVLREHGFTTVRADGNRRLYAMDATPLREVDEWLARYRRLWPRPLGALGTEPGRASEASRASEQVRGGEPGYAGAPNPVAEPSYGSATSASR